MQHVLQFVELRNRARHDRIEPERVFRGAFAEMGMRPDRDRAGIWAVSCKREVQVFRRNQFCADAQFYQLAEFFR